MRIPKIAVCLLVAGVALLGLSALPVQADPILLFNTGIGLPDSAIDPHYQLIGSADPSFPGPNTFVVQQSTGFPFPPAGPWMPDSPTSKWIAPRPDQNHLDNESSDGFPGVGGNSPGVYTYRTTFNLTGLNPATARITGQWAADNQGINIFINGNGTGQMTPLPGFNVFTPFTITFGFLPGLNTLDFQVNNVAGSTASNPTGLRVELSGTASPIGTPEPTTVLLVGAGLTGLAALRWRGRRR